MTVATSKAEQVAALPEELQRKFLDSLSPDEVQLLPYVWEFWARPKQLFPPGDWMYWLLLAGRGFGKTRSIAEFAKHKAKQLPRSRGAIIAATAADARDVVVEGESGIIACSPPNFRPVYEPSKRRLTWPNGTVATVFSADKPDRLRGPQFHWAVVDELAAWRYVNAWDMLLFGLRLGTNPQCAIATTPRPVAVIKKLLEDPQCVVTSGSTFENSANLAGTFLQNIRKKYENTRLGRQELFAHLLSEVPGALWNHELIDNTRVDNFNRTRIVRTVVAIDPPSTVGQCGIVVAALTDTGHIYILDDLSPEAGASPNEWAKAAIRAFNQFHCDRLVAEINHGGAMIETVIRNTPGGARIPYKAVRASQGKHTRAEPVAALWEQGYCHMVGTLSNLEDEMSTFVPGEESPNRMDALVWAVVELAIDIEPVVMSRQRDLNPFRGN